MRKSLLLVVITTIWLGIYSIIKAATADLTLEIMPGRIAIDSSGAVDIWAISSNPTTGEITTWFSSNSFRMIDMRWWSWYYTTIQFDDLIKWGDRIAKGYIQFKTIATPNTINGDNTGQIRFGSGIGNQYGYSDQPMTYFVRNPNQWTGLIGKYGDTPDIKITIPANQPSGAYRGTIYYTLYDME